MATRKKAAASESQEFVITPPEYETVTIKIRGSAPLVTHKFSKDSQDKMQAKQEAGQRASNKKERNPKNFKKLCDGATYTSKEGWHGVNAIGFRHGMISACRLDGFKMTKAKLSFDVLPDGFDKETLQPIVKITKGKPRQFTAVARNANGMPDLRSRPMWAPGWEATVRIRFDAGQFSSKDIVHLMMRVGKQVGIGDGRPDSPRSGGCGWGLFELL